jgi:hypothetical protein
MQDYLPLAAGVFFIAFVTYEVIHLIHSRGWHWKRTAHGCLEAFAFFIACIPVVAGASILANKMCRWLGMNHVEEVTAMKWLSGAVMIPLLIVWNGRRWGQLKGRRS